MEDTDGNPRKRQKKEYTKKPYQKEQSERITTPPETINSARQLNLLFSDLSPEALQHGFNSLRIFASNCKAVTDTVNEKQLAKNRRILKEWLEVQVQKDKDGISVDDSFLFLSQAWSYASQTTNKRLLFHMPAAITALLRAITELEDATQLGITLCRVLIQPNTLRAIQRSISGGRDTLASPSLRLLTEINKFNGGSFCGQLFYNFDFSVKDLGKGLEVKKSEVQLTYNPQKQTTRTVFIRFVMSFFENGNSSVKTELLGVKAFMSPLFKYLKNDPPLIIGEVLSTLKRKVLDDQEVPRSTKVLVFNEWVLGNIGSLYTRDQFIRDIGGKPQTVASVTHEFLMAVSTTPGHCICFKDSGWYPKAMVEGDEVQSDVKLYNRILSSFIRGLRPYSDPLQQDLLIAIFKSCPELVADYFSYEHLFSYDPRLTATWIGYTAFLTLAIDLPIPDNFGLDNVRLPPPEDVVIENIIPKPLNKPTMTKCLQHESLFIKFNSARLLISTFLKLRRVLQAIDQFTAQVDDKKPWEELKKTILEQHLLRVPELTLVISQYNAVPDTSILLKETLAKLIRLFYEIHPMIAFSTKFEVNTALGNFLSRENSGLKTPISLLELSHLLSVAKYLPDVRWWNKPTNMQFAPFIYVLKLFVEAPPTAPLHEIRNVLHSVTESTPLFQSETFTNSLDALLDSLDHAKTSAAFEPILLFLENACHRLVTKPHKYIDDYTQLAWEAEQKTLAGDKASEEPVYVKPVSGLIMALVEQWKFFLKSDSTKDIKRSTAVWMTSLLEAAVLIGENEKVILRLCDRLLEDCEGFPACKLVVRAFQLGLSEIAAKGVSRVDLVGDEDWESEQQTGSLRSIIKQKGVMPRAEGASELAQLATEVEKGEKDVSIFDFALVLRIIPALVKGDPLQDVDEADFEPALERMLGLLKLLLPIVFKGRDEAAVESLRRWIATNSALIELFLSTNVTSKAEDKEGLKARAMKFSESFIDILCFLFDGSHELLDGVYGRVFAAINELDSLPSKVIGKLKLLIRQTASQAQVQEISRLLSVASSRSSTLWDISASVLKRAKTLDEKTILKSLPSLNANETDKEFASTEYTDALWEFLTAIPTAVSDISIDDSHMDSLLHVGVVKSSEKSLVNLLACNDSSFRGRLLQHADEDYTCDCAKLEIEQFYISTILEAFSQSTDSKRIWQAGIDDAIKAKIQKNVANAIPFLVSRLPSPDAAKTLSWTVQLFPDLEIPDILGHVSKKNKKQQFAPEMVDLVEVSFEKDVGSAAGRNWLLIAMDHLTRIFSEHAVLGEESLELCRRIERLFKTFTAKVKEIPRMAVNAMLEAALSKHLEVLEVTKLAARVISQLPGQELNISRLLQIVLHNQSNPLLETSLEDKAPIRYYTAYIIYRLFSQDKTKQANIPTWDSVLLLYKGTDDLADRALFRVITQIEGRLQRSMASRVSEWTVGEQTEEEPVTISRNKGLLKVFVNTKVLLRSVNKCVLETPTFLEKVYGDLDKFIRVRERVNGITEDQPVVYDSMFMLAVLTYCMVSKEHLLDVQTAVEKACLSFALTCLSSAEQMVRVMARGFLRAFAIKAETAGSYREQTQILHFASTVLASLDLTDLEAKPLPSIVSTYLARISLVIARPTHFMYERVMESLMAGPTLHLTDIPRLLDVMNVSGVNYQRELDWIVTTLLAGLRSRKDVSLYFKRSVFEDLLCVHRATNTPEWVRENILAMFWNACAIKGAATTFVTRLGLLAWIKVELMKGGKEADRLALKRLAARLYETSNKEYVCKWARGKRNLGVILKGIFTAGNGEKVLVQKMADVTI